MATCSSVYRTTCGHNSSPFRLVRLFKYRVVQNTGLFLRVDNIATVNGRKAYDRPMSKVSEFFLGKV